MPVILFVNPSSPERCCDVTASIGQLLFNDIQGQAQPILVCRYVELRISPQMHLVPIRTKRAQQPLRVLEYASHFLVLRTVERARYTVVVRMVAAELSIAHG